MLDAHSNQIWHWLFTETWWSWTRSVGVPFQFTDIACHYFNLFEAVVWFAFSVLVLRRWWRYRRSSIEICYAAAFATFGASDLFEAWMLTSWLLWWKLSNLLLLFRLRRIVIRRCYPDSRLY